MGVQGETGKKLTVPSCSGDNEREGHYSVSTLEEKMIRDYTGYSFEQIDNMPVFEFWLLLRDAAIYNCKQTEQGQEYLEKCWRSEQTDPDRAALRKYFGKH